MPKVQHRAAITKPLALGQLIRDIDKTDSGSYKDAVSLALVRLRNFLQQRGARVRLIYLPAGENGEKVGLDDYLAAGHSVDELEGHASESIQSTNTDLDTLLLDYLRKRGLLK